MSPGFAERLSAGILWVRGFFDVVSGRRRRRIAVEFDAEVARIHRRLDELEHMRGELAKALWRTGPHR